MNRFNPFVDKEIKCDLCKVNDPKAGLVFYPDGSTICRKCRVKNNITKIKEKEKGFKHIGKY